MNSIVKETSISRHVVYPVLLVISFTHMLNDMIQSVIPAIYPMIKDRFSLTFAQIGIITLVFQLTSSLLQPFVGRYADYHPRPYSLALGMTFSLIGLFMLSIANNFMFILLSVSLIGCGSSVFHPESSQVARMASGGKKGLAQSIFQVGGNTGNAIGPLLVALIVIPYGQHSIVWFSIAAVIGCILLFKIGVWYSKQLSITDKLHKSTQAVRQLSKRKTNTSLVILIILIFSKYFYLASMTNYYTFFLIDKFRLSVQSSQLCLFVFLAASAIGIVIGGALGDKFGRKYVIWCSILGAAPFTMALPYVNLPLTILLSIIIGLVISSAFSAILVFATELMPGKVGMVAGIFYGLSFGLGGICSAFFGWLADATSIQYVFQISTVLPLLGVITGFLPNIQSSKS